MFTGIYGHKKQIAFLQKSIETGKFAHAFLFAGPAFIGKHKVARSFAASLLELKGDEFHPDFLEIGTDDTIKIEQIRELVYKLSLKPYQAKYKVAVIDNAENMTDDAQNSLLKILEEPKPYNVIILVSSNPGKLLRTISSRTQKINFGPVPKEEYQALIPDNLDVVTVNMILALAAGRPGLTSTISRDPDLVDKIKEIDRGFAIIKSKDLTEKLKLAYDLADMENADLHQCLDFWLIKLEQILAVDPTTENAKYIMEVNQSRRFLDQNVNSKLVLTNLMLNLE